MTSQGNSEVVMKEYYYRQEFRRSISRKYVTRDSDPKNTVRYSLYLSSQDLQQTLRRYINGILIWNIWNMNIE